MLEVVLVVALLVVGSAWAGSSKAMARQGRRAGLLGQLAPERPPASSLLPRPVPRLSPLRIAATVAVVAGFVVASVLWGVAPLSIFLGVATLFLVGDVVSTLWRRRADVGTGTPDG